MNSKKEIIILYGIIIGLILIMYTFLGSQRSNVFWKPIYSYSLYIILIGLFILSYIKKPLGIKGYNIFKKISHLAFLPVAVIPILKCYFRVPYVFCKICPQRCPWGLARPMIIPGFLIMNINKRSWCLGGCPFGKILSLQTKLSNKIIQLKGLLKKRSITQLLVLTFVIIVMMSSTIYYIISLNSFFFNPVFKIQIATIFIAAIFLIIGWFIPKFWCQYFCPIGYVGEKTVQIKRKISLKINHQDQKKK